MNTAQPSFTSPCFLIMFFPALFTTALCSIKLISYIVLLLWLIICIPHYNGNSKCQAHCLFCVAFSWVILNRACHARCHINVQRNKRLNMNAYQNARHSAEFLFLALFSANWLLDCQERLNQTVTCC